MTQILTVKTQKEEAKVTENLHPVVTRIHRSLTNLHSLKSHRFVKYWKFREEYAQRKLKQATEDGYADYQMNTGFAIVNSKIADILANTPKYDFVALDDEGKKYKKVRELFWKYVWEVSKTDASILSIVLDALKYGVGFGEEVVEEVKRKVKIPYLKDKAIEYKEEEICEYSGSKLNYIPWQNVYLNGSNIENTSEAIVITYWDRDNFLLTFGNDPKFSGITDENIPKGKYYYIGNGSNALYINGSTTATDRGSNTIENPQIVSVLTYYNKPRDEYIVLANDKWVNPIQATDTEGNPQENIQPIPYPHKEIPLVVYTDHILEDDIYGLGEFDITETSRQFKNDIRSLHIEGFKAQGGIITIDPNSDYDETVMKLGLRQIARVEKDSFGFFAPSVNFNSLDALEQKADEDIIIECGVDFKSQLLGPNETAKRTEGRIEASKKRISHNIKHNAYAFYERLARLRSANFEFWYKDKTKRLPVKGVEVSKDGSVEYVQNGYGMFTMAPEYFKGQISLIPVVDSLFGDTSSEVKQKYLETLQLLINMKKADGTPLFDQKLLIEAGRGIIDDVIDIDKVMGKSNDSKSPDDILKEAGLGDASQMPENGQGAPQGIPPAQQSGRPILLGSSPNQ